MIKMTSEVEIKRIKYPWGFVNIGVNIIDRSKYNEIAVASVPVGSRFVYGRREYVKLDNAYGGVFAARVDTEEGRFSLHNYIDVWCKCELRAKVHDIEHSISFEEIKYDDLLWFNREGKCSDLLSILTRSEYEKYHDLLPKAYAEEIEDGEIKKVPANEMFLTESDTYTGCCYCVTPDGEISEKLSVFDKAQYRKVLVLRDDVKVLVEKEKK